MTVHKHYKLIKKWAKNTDSVVWLYLEQHRAWQKLIVTPSWDYEYKYVVILPKYKKAWKAYLDGKLQLRLGDDWIDWQVLSDNHPSFSNKPKFYRRKPKS